MKGKNIIVKFMQSYCPEAHGLFVFGDLRWPNILITAGGLELVDFDWCGKEGEVLYPAAISEKISEWPKGVKGVEKSLIMTSRLGSRHVRP